jgi:flagellar basal-body rod protein FlgB
LDLFDTTVVGLQRAMSGANLREQVLANNIANADTPNFKRSDVDFHAALAQAFSGQATPAQIGAVTFQPQTDGASVIQADGNNVDIDREMSSLSENSLDYQSLSSVLATRLAILKTAIGTTP